MSKSAWDLEPQPRLGRSTVSLGASVSPALSVGSFAQENKQTISPWQSNCQSPGRQGQVPSCPVAPCIAPLLGRCSRYQEQAEGRCRLGTVYSRLLCSPAWALPPAPGQRSPARTLQRVLFWKWSETERARVTAGPRLTPTPAGLIQHRREGSQQREPGPSRAAQGAAAGACGARAARRVPKPRGRAGRPAEMRQKQLPRHDSAGAGSQPASPLCSSSSRTTGPGAS